MLCVAVGDVQLPARDEVEGRLAIDERHLHAGGYVHGGVWVTFADTVAAGRSRRSATAHESAALFVCTQMVLPGADRFG